MRVRQASWTKTKLTNKVQETNLGNHAKLIKKIVQATAIPIGHDEVVSHTCQVAKNPAKRKHLDRVSK